METIQQFLCAARKKNKEGKLFLDKSVHSLNKCAINRWLKHIESVEKVEKNRKDRHKVATELINKMVYINFQDFCRYIVRAFIQFLQEIGDKKYIMIVETSKSSTNKSNRWVGYLLVFLAKQESDAFLTKRDRCLLTKHYKDPEYIISDTSYIKEHGIDDNTVCMFCDDGIFSGTQMQYHLFDLNRALQPKTKQNTNIQNEKVARVKVYIISVIMGKIAENRLSHCCTQRTYLKQCLEPHFIYSKRMEGLGYKELNNMFPSYWYMDEGCKKIPNDYAQCLPVYFEHKIPDAVSSFPSLLMQGYYIDTYGKPHQVGSIINQCNTKENASVLEGSSLGDGCVEPFYKKQ
jgi:hypothetical protein